MDDTLRQVRAYLRAHPEANAGHRIEGKQIVVGIAGDLAAHEAPLRAIGGDRVVLVSVARPVRDLIALQARIEAEFGAAVRSMSAAPLEGVVRVEADGEAAALLAERYGDAVRIE